MEFLTLLAPLLTKVLENLFPDPTAQAQAKVQLQDALNQAAAIEAQKEQVQSTDETEILTSWIKGTTWMQQNWLPIFMFMFMIIIADNWLIIPLLHPVFPSLIAIPMPDQMWTLIYIALGVHGGGKGIETVANAYFNNDKFLSSLESRIGKLTGQQISAIKESISDAEKSDNGG